MTAGLPSGLKHKRRARGTMGRIENKKLDKEWIILMEEAFFLGLTPDEIRTFLTENRVQQ